jgi:hypothetical protein
MTVMFIVTATRFSNLPQKNFVMIYYKEVPFCTAITIAIFVTAW